MSSRNLAVSGQFYPETKEELNRYIDHFNNILKENNIDIKQKDNLKAVIVPHAGYIYSGFTANMAYRHIPGRIKNIIVIGPSHKFTFEGASVSLYDTYPTPYGDLSVNKSLGEELVQRFDFLTFDKKVHCEHSTEVQFPFIKKYLENVNVLEIVYSKADFNDIALLIKELLRNKDNLVVISTDLSHFYDLDTANKLDNICLNSILHKDLELDKKGCQACGITGVKGIIKTAVEDDLKIELLDYRTSADITNDKESVVGYSSFIIS